MRRIRRRCWRSGRGTVERTLPETWCGRTHHVNAGRSTRSDCAEAARGLGASRGHFRGADRGIFQVCLQQCSARGHFVCSSFRARRSEVLGHTISAPEVTHISRHGFWLLLGQDELLVRFEDFPWFRQATIDALTQVEWPSPDHLYWPQLDVDLSVQSIRSPSDFPLLARPDSETDLVN
ncbi:MAG: DUF2442 domain-containing protein [Gemmatimonadaceae bacterium]|nr:DUF2442 domain-containing protein [Gemmatimonadaceae bacterium]